MAVPRRLNGQPEIPRTERWPEQRERLRAEGPRPDPVPRERGRAVPPGEPAIFTHLRERDPRGFEAYALPARSTSRRARTAPARALELSARCGASSTRRTATAADRVRLPAPQLRRLPHSRRDLAM